MYEKPLFQQIYDQIKASIDTGALKPGDRLPPVTDLASQHGVTPATIRRALADLVDQGLVSSHVGRGTFVSQPGPSAASEDSEATKTIRNALPPAWPGDELSGRAFPVRGTSGSDLSQTLAGLMNLAQNPGVIGFTRGMGDPGMIEKGILTRLTLRALSEGEELFWDYGDPRGLPILRESIARLYKAQGIQVSPDQILVTSGSQQALYLLAQQAQESSLPVVCETPCYAGVTNAFRAFGLDISTVSRDASGPDASRLAVLLARRPALLYLCPFLHNPMGTDLEPGRRAEVLRLARQHHSLVISDEVFRDLHPEKTAPASLLKDMGIEGGFVLGSLSKSFISGLRVGWIVGSAQRIQDLARIKKNMDLGCPPLMQGIAAAFLDDPEGYRPHRERIARHYLERRDAALSALEEFMPAGVAWTRPQGGFQLWVTLPEGRSSVELYLRAVEGGVAFLPGPLQDMSGGFANSFRLCYGSLEVPEIREGLRRLGQAATRYFAAPAQGFSAQGMGDF